MIVRCMCRRYLFVKDIFRKSTLRFSSSKIEHEQSPIEFSKTTAAKWRAEYSRYGSDYKESTWVETISFTISLLAMVVYFGELREENDIDEELGMPLGKRLFQMHLQTLYRQRADNISRGLSTIAVDEEIADVENQKKKYNF